MNKTEKSRKLAEVKLALAEKCDRLGKVTKSITKQNTMKYQACAPSAARRPT